MNNLDHYNAIKTSLINDKIEFYSHDVNVKKFDQYILSGLNKVDPSELINELISSGFEVVSINEIPNNKRRNLQNDI